MADGSIDMAGATSAHDLELKASVDAFINEAQVVIFAKAKCPHCQNTIKIFDELKASYSVVDLNDQQETQKIQDILGDMTGARTVPRVFVDGKCIGGNSDTIKLFETGELKEMLEKSSSDSKPSKSMDHLSA